MFGSIFIKILTLSQNFFIREFNYKLALNNEHSKKTELGPAISIPSILPTDSELCVLNIEKEREVNNKHKRGADGNDLVDRHLLSKVKDDDRV